MTFFLIAIGLVIAFIFQSVWIAIGVLALANILHMATVLYLISILEEEGIIDADKIN